MAYSSSLQQPGRGPGQCLVETDELGVKYTIGARREDLQSRVSTALAAWAQRQSDSHKEERWALRDVQFSAHAGEVVGIIGANGAGKTTLCKVLAGLLRPDVGQAHVHGSVSALLALGVGFRPDLSGRDNILLNGMMLGLSRKQLATLFPRIVEQAGLEQFIEQAVRTYSTGMRARLGFSIATMLAPDVLILDEVLTAGDLAFRTWAGEKIQELVQTAKLVIVVTHQLAFVEQFCTRAVWLERGRLRADGPPSQVVADYTAQFAQKTPAVQSPVIPAPAPPLSTTPVIHAQQLGVQFSLRRQRRAFWALSGVSFRITEGEVVGLIGPNGAGKTTLCRVLSGILQPDAGRVERHGDISALLTLGTGFNFQLSGHDNIYLNGMMLGLSKQRLDELYHEIVAFSGLGPAIQQPLKQYSQGMRIRLGFSIAAMIRPDIFLVDEALGAGDLAFYKKASAKMQELITSAKAVVIVSHNLELIERLCTRALWLGRGKIQFDGPATEAVAHYRQAVQQAKRS